MKFKCVENTFDAGILRTVMKKHLGLTKGRVYLGSVNASSYCEDAHIIVFNDDVTSWFFTKPGVDRKG